jgi:hypothetical protein
LFIGSEIIAGMDVDGGPGASAIGACVKEMDPRECFGMIAIFDVANCKSAGELNVVPTMLLNPDCICRQLFDQYSGTMALSKSTGAPGLMLR